MKSYGKVDKIWDDAKFQAMIEDALQMAREQKKPFAVGQDVDGTAVVALSEEDYPPIFACAATAWDDEEFQEGNIELVDNVAYHEYSIDDMVPRVRDALTKGMVEYGSLRFLSEGRYQLGDAVACAHTLVELHKCPFIIGLTSKGIIVAPLSERNRFLDVASCVVTKNGVWSMSDKLPGGYGYWEEAEHSRSWQTHRRAIRSGSGILSSMSTAAYWNQEACNISETTSSRLCDVSLEPTSYVRQC